MANSTPYMSVSADFRGVFSAAKRKRTVGGSECMANCAGDHRLRGLHRVGGGANEVP